jgi:prepilin-type N-terminal cleavage/methylation domain-containing protein
MKDIKNKLFANMNVNVNTNTKSGNNNGFTIIEVALVLAIAGLIFLVVFLALPALQNSQKDTARKQDVGRVVSALQQYEADNGGHMPLDTSSSGNDFSNYPGKLSSGYSIVTKDWDQGMSGKTTIQASDVNSSEIDIFAGLFCPNSSDTSDPENNSAVAIKLSSGSIYCVNIQGPITAEIYY